MEPTGEYLEEGPCSIIGVWACLRRQIREQLELPNVGVNTAAHTPDSLAFTPLGGVLPIRGVLSGWINAVMWLLR